MGALVFRQALQDHLLPVLAGAVVGATVLAPKELQPLVAVMLEIPVLTELSIQVVVAVVAEP
jgi:hypothetical protein